MKDTIPLGATFAQIVRVANAAGRDAGNRSMARGNRRAWNEEDNDAAHEANDVVIRAYGYGHLIDAAA